MRTPYLLHDLVLTAAEHRPEASALSQDSSTVSYESLANQIEKFSGALLALGLSPDERVGIYLEKRAEAVVACFGASAAGQIFVPINPVLKPAQVSYQLENCGAKVLVTTSARWRGLSEEVSNCPDLVHVVLIGESTDTGIERITFQNWQTLLDESNPATQRRIDTDLAAILYTSGSTGMPKGVVLSHRNMVAGAQSVASYLENNADDTILAALPLSFDAGFSQLTTAFCVGAKAVLLNYLLPRDVLNAMVSERVTGLTAVPPMWMQLTALDWPEKINESLRYFANTGGHMPLDTLTRLRQRVPNAKPYLMYGLTEAFRATYLPPELVDERPDSIGRAIPNCEVLVLREDGTRCAVNEPGELVQRGALVGQGYWKAPEQTAIRYRPLPDGVQVLETGSRVNEMAVFSGDIVRMDEEGFLYFVGRRDEMIKTSGYRVSPTEIEEVFHGLSSVRECVAFGVPHDTLGQAICTLVVPVERGAIDVPELKAECQKKLPRFMVPTILEVVDASLPRNANGKIDRKTIAATWQELIGQESSAGGSGG